MSIEARIRRLEKATRKRTKADPRVLSVVIYHDGRYGVGFDPFSGTFSGESYRSERDFRAAVGMGEDERLAVITSDVL